MMTAKQKQLCIKPRKCRVCRNDFQPHRCLQQACSYECEVALAELAAAKSKAKRERDCRVAEMASRKVIKLKLDKLKTARDWTKDAQIAFNAYIRERDKDKPCICCGQNLSSGDVGGKFDCGHYRSVGSAPHLRFDERNAHGQRKQCNRYGSGRAVDYRIGLINRFGIAFVESIEADQEPRKYTIDELKAIKAHYAAKLKELKQ